MIRATPLMRDFARRVVVFETRKNGSSGTTAPVVFAVCEKLRPQWANLMGQIGYRTLLSRALTMASTEVKWLGEVKVKADGSLEASDKLDAQMDPDKMAAGSAVLIAELLGLLEGFIGGTLAMRLMHDVWPELPPPVNFSKSKGAKI